MELSDHTLSAFAALFLLTPFIKVTTVLSICRYGLGLVGVEFGIVCLVVGIGLSSASAPAELAATGFNQLVLGQAPSAPAASLNETLIPLLRKRLDPIIAEQFAIAEAVKDSNPGDSGRAAQSSEYRSIVPAFVLSELKGAFQLGCMLLIPLVAIDLLVAHLMTLVGMQQLAAQAVALPLKIVVFITAGGWGLLGKKLLGME